MPSLSLFLGVLLFKMTYGYRPFEHILDNYEKMSYISQLTQTPPIPPNGNVHVRDIIQQCLQIQPDNRPHAEQLLQHAFFSN